MPIRGPSVRTKASKSRAKPTAAKSKPSAKPKGPVGSDAVILSRDRVVSRVNPDRTVSIMRFDDDEHFFVLDGIAAELWMMIDGKRTLGRIKEALIRKHKPPLKRFDRDVNGLVRKLRSEGLVDRV